MRKRVYLLAIRHDHGLNLLASATEEDRTALLYDYVTDWWHEIEGSVGPMPEEPGLAIDTYFDNHPSEWYELNHQDVKFPD